MLIVTLKPSILSTTMFSSYALPMSWLSLAGSAITYYNTLDIFTFNLINDKRFCLTKKLFVQILELPNSPPFYKVKNEQVLHMLNEMGYQPSLTKISEFKKSCLTCIWNNLFCIYLRCLTGRSIGLEKGRL